MSSIAAMGARGHGAEIPLTHTDTCIHTRTHTHNGGKLINDSLLSFTKEGRTERCS